MPDTREVLRRSIEAWNAHDRQRWTEFAADDIELVVSGGVRLRGLEGARQMYDTWTTAFPDNRVEPVLEVVDGAAGVHESHFRGTHTGTMRSPSGEIPATGHQVDIPFIAVLSVENSKLTSFRVYFDQLDMLTQLGLTGSQTPESALA